jgi:hypothetical protein
VGEFFKGWRWKAELMMLAMAMLLTGAWMRSYVFADMISVDFLGQQYVMVSVDGGMAWDWYPRPTGSLRYERRAMGGPAMKSVARQNSALMLCKVPYWSFVWPPTLLSVWLIVAKPRKRVAQSIEAADVSPQT